MVKVIKKDGTKQDYNKDKIISACKKSAQRAMVELKNEDFERITKEVELELFEKDLVEVKEIHAIVERVLLELYPIVGSQYQQYRNYKLDFVSMLDDVYTKSQNIRYIGDVSNANTDSAMVSTQRSLIYGELNKSLYQKFFLNKDELQACNDGYIYVHDMKDRLDSLNCCLFDMENVLSGGFEMGNIWYNEPKTLDVAFDVISDITMSASSQQYGGFTIARVDKILSKYANKSYIKYLDEYIEMLGKEKEDKCKEYALSKVRRDMEQGFQSWEYRFNTVGSSRGDYPQ